MNSSKKDIALCGALLCTIMMLSELIDPTIKNPSGRWAFLFSPIWNKFGSIGLVTYWGMISAIFFFIYFRSKK